MGFWDDWQSTLTDEFPVTDATGRDRSRRHLVGFAAYLRAAIEPLFGELVPDDVQGQIDTIDAALAAVQAEVDALYAVPLQRSTQWFNIPLDKDAVLAPTPGTADADAMSRFGRINVVNDGTINAVHLHYDHPAGTGAYAVELWRRRGVTNTRIATCAADGGLGDFGMYLFVFADPVDKALVAGDYLLMQATSKMTGAGAKNAVAFVDVHWDPVTLGTLTP